MKPYRLAAPAILLLIFLAGCDKRSSEANPTPEIEAKLAAIRQVGEPVTLTELDAWYVEPSTGENAAPLYAEAFAALTTEDANSLTFREQNPKAVELLHRAAARTPCRFPTDLKAGERALLTHLAKIKPCGQLLAQEAVQSSIKGKLDLAVRNVVDALRLGRSLQQEPLVISQTVRIGVEQNAAAALEIILSRGVLSAKELEELQAAFEETDNGGNGKFARAFAGERCMAISMFLLPSREASTSLSGTPRALPPEFFNSYRKSSTNHADFNYCLDQFANLVAAAKLPFPDGLDALASWDDQVRDAKSRGFYFATTTTLPNSAKVLERSAVVVGYLRASKTALAVERYRLAHAAALPVALSTLVPQYLTAVPADPFDGKPIRYKKVSPKGYMVYGIGPDRKDDGGTELKREMPRDANYDLVFTIRR